MESTKENNKIILELSNEESLVLLNWLFRFNANANENTASFEDQAEERVLWDMEAVLEKIMSETLSSDYAELLSQARQKVRDEE